MQILSTVYRESFTGKNFRELRGFEAILVSFNRKKFIEYGSVIINGCVIVISHNLGKF